MDTVLQCDRCQSTNIVEIIEKPQPTQPMSMREYVTNKLSNNNIVIYIHTLRCKKCGYEVKYSIGIEMPSSLIKVIKS